MKTVRPLYKLESLVEFKHGGEHVQGLVTGQILRLTGVSYEVEGLDDGLEVPEQEVLASYKRLVPKGLKMPRTPKPPKSKKATSPQPRA